MKFKLVEMKPIKQIPICDCGGEIEKVDNDITLLTYPPKYLCKCKECGKDYTLSSSEVPHIYYKEGE